MQKKIPRFPGCRSRSAGTLIWRRLTWSPGGFPIYFPSFTLGGLVPFLSKEWNNFLNRRPILDRLIGI